MTDERQQRGVLSCQMPITFDQSDPAGILFYGNIFHFAHRAFERLIESVAIAWDDWFASDQFHVPIIHADVDFTGALPAGRYVDVEVRAAELRTSACAIAYDFLLGGKVCAKVQTVHVFVDSKTRAKIPIPQALRKKLER